MAESISQRVDAIDDPMSNRALYALFMSLKTDLEAIKAVYNIHYHASTGAGNFPVAPNTIGTYNTTT